MLKEKDLSNEYWAEAVACSAYIINRFPMKVVINEKSQEAWRKRKQNITHLRIFGCVAYSLVPQAMRQKLDDRGEKAYRLYNPITKKLIISRDVEFLEEEAWDGTLDKSNTVASSVPEENETQDVHSTTQTDVPTTPTRAPTTPSTTTPASTNTPSTTTPASTNSSESSNPTLASLRSRSINTSRKTQSLRDIYDELQEAENNYSCINFALLAHCDPISFEEAIKDDKWISAMDEEIQSIEKNDT